VSILIKAGADINIQANMEFNQWAALHFGILTTLKIIFFIFVLLIAANFSQIDIIKSLLDAKNKIELNILDLFGFTPLFYGNYE
jgi:hypothetical protein